MSDKGGKGTLPFDTVRMVEIAPGVLGWRFLDWQGVEHKGSAPTEQAVNDVFARIEQIARSRLGDELVDYALKQPAPENQVVLMRAAMVADIPGEE